jgi:hypothetical protein
LNRRREKMKKQASIMMAFSLILLFTATPFVGISAQSPSTVLKVEPVDNIFYTNTTDIGHTFTISIIAENIPSPGFYGWEFWLSWTPGVINCTLETLNTGIWSAYSVWVSEPIDNAAGTYHQSMTARYPATPKTGTYWLANVTFKICKAPATGGSINSPLTISPPEGMTYCLGDKEANSIPHDYIHGVYKYISPRPPLPETKLQVTPAKILDPSLEPCHDFNINVTIINAIYLHGFNLKLGYNATILECTTVEEGGFLANFGSTTMAYAINNTEGYIFVSVNLTTPEATAEGTGTLAKFTFHVIGIGDSIIHLYETELFDMDEAPLPHVTSDGYFNNVLMPKLYVDPPLILDPSMTPSDEFQVNINVANISDLYDFEFTLLYDTTVLNGLGLLVIPFANQTSFDLQFMLNDTCGKIWVKVQYYPPAEPLTTISPKTLVRLFFQIQSYGATTLHFNKTKLSNSLGMLITHIAEDGYVSVLRRDIAIIGIKPEFYEGYKGWIIKINVTAKNLGDIPETFNVTLYLNSNKADQTTILNLPSHANTTITLLFDTMAPWAEACHNYTIKAEASQVPYEIDTSNNIMEDGQIHIRLMGDINGDKIVNYQDAIAIGVAFGSKPTDPNWNPLADLNRDGYINYLDVIIMGANFGESCT